MKKSSAIKFTLLNGIIITMGACGPSVLPPDPCKPMMYNPMACQEAVQNHGYYYQGDFFPMQYLYPYSYYYGGYNSYLAGGGYILPSPYGMYRRNYTGYETRLNDHVMHVGGQTYISGRTMSRFTASRPTFAARVGPTVARGGFGSIGASHGGASS